MSLVTYDTYEASYYLTKGAQVIEINFRKAPSRKGYSQQWRITLDNVNEEDIKSWKEGTATGNLREFASARLKLKQKVNKVKRKWDTTLGNPHLYHQGERVKYFPKGKHY